MLAEDALEAVQPMTESRHQALTKHLSDKLPMVWVDVDMIRRVLINLLENASKFSPPESKIQLGGKLEQDQVQLWVQDDGPGIPFIDQERIFDKFARLKEQNSISGLGVGLAFCRLAVQGHGGKIWVESQPGHGSKFILTLPIANEK
jgi:signal transduction histidine kinase